jgi:hypothetical protein
MDRRKFCLSSAAATISGVAAGLSCLPAAGQKTSAMPATAAPILPIYKFIYDRRYSAGRAFGAAAEGMRSTAGIVAIDGDITALWSRDLRAHWSTEGGAIAGMTSARSLFCLEQLAKDHWMRVVIRAEHALEAHGVTHWVTASEPMIARMKSALTAENWPAKMPTALTTCQDADGAPRTTCVIELKGNYGWAATVERLVSFVIA